MFSGHLREMVMYERSDSGTLRKVRTITPSFYEPPRAREVFAGATFTASRVFPPDGNFLPAWGVLMILAVLYQAAMVPLMMAFVLEDTPITFSLDFISSVVFMLDIAVSFNTGFYKKGMLIVSRRKIMSRYLRTWFIVDVLSIFPYDWLFQRPLTTQDHNASRAPTLFRVAKVGRLLRSLRLVRIAKLKTHLIRISTKLMDSKLAIVFKAFYLLTIMLGVAHWVACGFFYVSTLADSVDNWIFSVKLQDAQVKDQYVAALYWAITTLTTTGYGDIHPINSNEKLYGIMIMVISAGSFSYFIGKIGSSIANVDRDAKDHKDLTLAMTRYLKQAEVPKHVINRALRYMDYLWETRKKRKILDKHVMTHFSEPLKNEISEHIYGPMMLTVPMFGRFDRVLISQLSRTISIEVFAQDDLIFQSSQTSSQLYFVEKGTVEIFHHKSEHTFAILKPGEHFGELAFFLGQPRCASARCLEFSELLSLRREDFLKLLSPDGVYSCKLLHDLYLSKNFEEIGISCYLCSETNHLASDCPHSRIIIDKQRICQKWITKRIYRSMTISPENSEPNFERRERKVRRGLRHSVDSIRRENEFSPLKREMHKRPKPMHSLGIKKTLSAIEEDRNSRFEGSDFDPISSESCLLSDEAQARGYNSEIQKDNLFFSRPTLPIRDRRKSRHSLLRAQRKFPKG